MTHVFISYSRKDTPFVVRLEAELNKLGIATWRDATSIPGGDDWYQNIVTGLSGAYATALLRLTPTSRSGCDANNCALTRTVSRRLSSNRPSIAISYICRKSSRF